MLAHAGTMLAVKRPVRTRMQGVAGAGGEKAPATRLCIYLFRIPEALHFII